MMILKSSDGKPTTLPVLKQLDDLLNPLFAVLPSLEFHAHRTRGLAEGKFISEVIVYDGEQRLGKIGYVHKYTRSGYIDAYQIESRKIRKERGDRNCRTTSNVKAALKIAKEVFVKDPEHMRGPKIYAKLKSEYHSIVWHCSSTYQDKCKPLLSSSFDYMISAIDGNPQPLDPAVVQVVQSDKFKQSRDNYRIAKSIENHINKEVGAVVYVDRQGKLSLFDAGTKALTKIESTYDLPKNYQEKYTILKVMELNQPIENVGVKLEVDVDDVKATYFYLCPGDTVVTH